MIPTTWLPILTTLCISWKTHLLNFVESIKWNYFRSLVKKYMTPSTHSFFPIAKWWTLKMFSKQTRKVRPYMCCQSIHEDAIQTGHFFIVHVTILPLELMLWYSGPNSALCYCCHLTFKSKQTEINSTWINRFSKNNISNIYFYFLNMELLTSQKLSNMDQTYSGSTAIQKTHFLNFKAVMYLISRSKHGLQLC